MDNHRNVREWGGGKMAGIGEIREYNTSSMQHTSIDETLFNRSENPHGVSSGVSKEERGRKTMQSLGEANAAHHAYFGDVAQMCVQDVPPKHRWAGNMPDIVGSRNLITGTHIDAGDQARSLSTWVAPSGKGKCCYTCFFFPLWDLCIVLDPPFGVSWDGRTMPHASTTIDENMDFAKDMLITDNHQGKGRTRPILALFASVCTPTTRLRN